MSELKFKAKLDNPQGKPRVYFACHPNDFSVFFDSLSTEIMKISDCAVFYYEPDEDMTLDEDYYLDLSQMQMFVMPVTGNLLLRPCRAIDVEFPYAIEHHVPVLPIMLESGLEADFSRKCGDLQFLDKTLHDVTAIPYEEKLKTLLQSVLVGDELSAKVRAAFDAYIFLSYRKKDRKYAQQLMRLIHKNEFCRDIAIWYDEFLTPGENFNGAIEDALRKSKLFALAVTPNLVNEVNYVMTTEYPMAKEAGKPILPAEMVHTDKAALKDSYADIPECTDAYDEPALSAAMVSMLQDLAIRENDADPQHNFFIGLAYLGGIDVEVDHERALSLITGAAEAGLTEAMEKLAAMYHNGEGVQRDYHKEIQWLERLCNQAREEYETTGDRNKAFDYRCYLNELGNAWGIMHRFKESKKCYLKALELDEALAKERESLTVLRHLSADYDNLGSTCKEEGSLSEARTYQKKCLEAEERLAAGTDAARDRLDLAGACLNMGRLSEAEGNLSEARSYFERSLKVLQSMAKEAETDEVWRRIFLNHLLLGDIAYRQDKEEDAQACYEKALKIADRLERETDTAEARRLLSLCYERLGRNIENHHLTHAREFYSKQLEIDMQLADELGTPGARRSVVVGLFHLGDIYRFKEELPQAREYYTKAVEAAEQLKDETNTIQARDDLSLGYQRLGSVCEQSGALAEAEKYHLKHIETALWMAQKMDTPDTWLSLASGYTRLANTCMAAGKMDDARIYAHCDIEIREKLVRHNDTVRDYEDIAAFCNVYGRTIPDRVMTEKAWFYYNLLAERCPDKLRYRFTRDNVKKRLDEWELENS